MKIVEFLYNLKKKIVRFWKAYFTMDGTYTSLIPDRIYLRKKYKERMGKELNLKHPSTFTEKMNWLKLYDRKPQYTMMVDKYAVRKYVAQKIGEQYLVPLIGCWENVEEIDFESLPEQFVLKCNHDNGVIICKDKKSLDIEAVKKELSYHLKRNYYKKAREWPYKNVPRKIICEKYISSVDQEELVDYKFHCFSGMVKLLAVIIGRGQNMTIDMFDADFNHLEVKDKAPNFKGEICKPEQYEEMVQIARKLSKDIPYVRIDLYNLKGKIYFGEMTFFDDAGFMKLHPQKWDDIIGEWIELPKKM